MFAEQEMLGQATVSIDQKKRILLLIVKKEIL